VEWYRQGKTEVFGERPVPLQFGFPQSPLYLDQPQTLPATVQRQQLTACVFESDFLLNYL